MRSRGPTWPDGAEPKWSPSSTPLPGSGPSIRSALVSNSEPRLQTGKPRRPVIAPASANAVAGFSVSKTTSEPQLNTQPESGRSGQWSCTVRFSGQPPSGTPDRALQFAAGGPAGVVSPGSSASSARVGCELSGWVSVRLPSVTRRQPRFACAPLGLPRFASVAGRASGRWASGGSVLCAPSGGVPSVGVGIGRCWRWESGGTQATGGSPRAVRQGELLGLGPFQSPHVPIDCGPSGERGRPCPIPVA